MPEGLRRKTENSCLVLGVFLIHFFGPSEGHIKHLAEALDTRVVADRTGTELS